jgi:predicted phage terminase large subunit-like protein
VTVALAQRLAQLTAEQRYAVMASLSPEELAALEYRWEFWARPDQLPPPGDWRTWLLLGGRGSGKTRAAAEWVRAEMEAGRRLQMGIVAPTADSLRRICVEGPSGLLSVGPPSDRPQFEPSTRRVVYANGGIVHLFSAEEPDRLRGPNLSGLWIDELTSMPSGGAEVWDMAQMALRIPGPLGHAPRAVVTTTPKMQALLKQIIAAPSTTVTRARTSDNASNLDASTLAYLREKYGDTRLGRQEMDAELLADLEGALWNRALIDECRIKRGDQPERLRRVVVAVDPPGGASKANAECGIIVAALGADRHGYVLADLSGRMSPEQWARRVVEAYHGYKADKIVAEQNFGGAMVESTIRSIDSRVPIKMVVASRGKQIRAEPVASWYEQHRVHHVGEFPALEDQMTGWDPAESGPSPDRVDACVWALTELMGGPGPMRISPEAVAAIANMAPMPGSPAYDRARLYGRRW